MADGTASHGSAADRRWWIGEGSEPCPFCFQGYSIEVEMRCLACGLPGCIHCVIRTRTSERLEVLCPDCLGEGQPNDVSGSAG